MTTLTPPLKWHGGKSYLAKRIIAEMPPRCKNPNKPDPDDTGWLHYVEPYFGGGAVLLAQDPEGISEVVNDLNWDLVNFWNVVRNPELFPLFQRQMEAMPFCEGEWDLSSSTTESLGSQPDQIQKAVAFFVFCRQSMSGRMDSFAPLTRNRTRRGMNEQASAWLNAVEGLPAVHARLKRVVILNGDAISVLTQQDGPRTLFYLDPPYLRSTRFNDGGEYGEHEMTAEDHANLLAWLETVKGRFILSGYHSEMYDDNATAFGWRCVEIEIDNKSSAKKSKDKKTECLWFNYDPSYGGKP